MSESQSQKSSWNFHNNYEKIKQSKKNLKEKDSKAELICQNIEDADISDASVILFWFTDEIISQSNVKKI